MNRCISPLFLVIILLSACSEKKKEHKTSSQTVLQTEAPSPFINYKLLKEYPHDTTAFTEGFLVHNGVLYESTGAPDNLPQTRSAFGIVDLKTGKLDIKGELDKEVYFGEGISILNNKLYQLTYKNQKGFIYDLKSYKQTGTFSYANAEGWGMTTDGTYLIMSDGSSMLTFIDPFGMKPVKTIAVKESEVDVSNLNELEWINGFLYANVWMTNYILKIDPVSGKVVGKMDLSSLYQKAKSKYPGTAELNGIAYDKEKKVVYVTGKLWPFIYQLELN